MDDKQEIAFLKAKVDLLEKNHERLEKRVDKQDEERKAFERELNGKLDVLLKESMFIKGVTKAIFVIASILLVATPILIKLAPLLKSAGVI